jgi:hypothetical protein
LGIAAQGPSLVLNDPELLETAFPIRKTLRVISRTAGGQASPKDIIASMLESYTVDRRINSRLSVPVDVRSGEASMPVAELLERLKPVAVFNRIDLRASSGADCGEYRIVYALQASEGTIAGRFLVIFEARMPNIAPHLGEAACLPIARRWAKLSHAGVSDEQRIRRLRKFFYKGLRTRQGAFPPAFHAANFQGSRGQIRTNNFIDNVKWQLREFRTTKTALGVRLIADTVKDVPLAELYAPTEADDPMHRPSLAFKKNFIIRQVKLLLTPELEGATDPTDFITGLRVAFGHGSFEFQSDAQGLADDPTQIATGDGFRLRVQDTIDNLLEPDSGVTVDMVLNRAGALTCGGCHDFSAGRVIAPAPFPGIDTAPITWPAPAGRGFVHVTESGELSPALTDHFLPVRKRLLEDFICNPPVVLIPTAAKSAFSNPSFQKGGFETD